MIKQLSDFLFPETPQHLYPQTPERPWVLEIGFGDGRFWPAYAASFDAPPNYLGVEISGVSLLKAQRRLREAGLDNAHLTKLMATPLLEQVVAPRSLDSIVVNFPDPWPKAEHLEHRLLRAPFFRLAASRLKVGGALLLTTDHDEYFEFACREAEESGVMEVLAGTAPAAALQTKYALKWEGLGLRPNHARMLARDIPLTDPLFADVPAATFAPLPTDTSQENALPHAIVKLPTAFDPAAFDKQTVRGAAYTVVLLEAYRSLRRDELTVLAHVVEQELTQEVLVNVTTRPDGSSLVRLGRFGGPIITPGVKAAVGAVADWLAAQGAEVKHRGY